MMRPQRYHQYAKMTIIISIAALLLLISIGALRNQSRTQAVAATPLVGVYTERYDNTRIGVNSNETILTPASVNSTNFGKLFNEPVDGEVYAQPLYVPFLTIAGQGTHNVVYVATEHDSIYGFDADRAGVPLLHVNLLGAGETTVTPSDVVNCTEITNEIGITGTPVIDPATNTLCVVARSKLAGPPMKLSSVCMLSI